MPAYASNPPIDWQLEHTTVVTSPKDRKRTKVGVGEKVDLKAPCPADWTIQGGGTLSVATGATTQFTAPETAAQVTITAKFHVDNSTKTVTFNVVEPNGLTMDKIVNTITQNQPSLALGFTAKVFILPADVNFEAISVGENKVASVTTGYFDLRFPNGLEHDKNGPVSMAGHIENKGTPINGFDTITTGTSPPLGNPAKYSAGTFLWAIPWRYELGATTKVFTTANHRHKMTIDANTGKATLELSKTGLTHQTTEQ